MLVPETMSLALSIVNHGRISESDRARRPQRQGRGKFADVQDARPVESS
jgi:hypothetical protein